MSRRIEAMVKMRARLAAAGARADRGDLHESARKRDTVFALAVLAIVLLGGPIVDLWFPDPIETSGLRADGVPELQAMTWLPDAPDYWLHEEVDIPPPDGDEPEPITQPAASPDIWKKIPPPCRPHDRTCID